MWSVGKTRTYLLKKLPELIQYHNEGNFENLELGFEELEDNINRSDDSHLKIYFLALSFWDSWIDASENDWQYYEPLTKDDWPKLAEQILKAVQDNKMMTDTKLFKELGLI